MIVISGERYIELVKVAKKEFTKFKRRKNKEVQCLSTLKSCMVGVFSEEAAAEFIKGEAGSKLEYISQLGLKERVTPRMKASCDIGCKVGGKHYRYEVKAISKGQVKGMITPYHQSKYATNKVDKVIFVEVTLCEGYVECEVYLLASPSEIKGWNKVNNSYGNPCYTHPSFEDEAFLRGKY